MAPINHLGFHLGTYRSALSSNFPNEERCKASGWISSKIYPDFPLQHPLSIKTLIAHKLSDLELHSPEYLIGTKLSNGRDGFLVLLGNSDGLPITIPQLLSKSLLLLLEMYKKRHQIGGDEIRYSCCIGIPIYFTHIQRSIVQDAARQAGFTSIALVHETTAAVINLSFEGLLDNYSYVVLVDMGVISTQVSVVNCQKGRRTRILSHAFDSALGGRAFDMVLLNHFVVKFRDEHGIDATNDSNLYWKLYSACEKMKIELSTHINASFVIRVGDKKLIGSINRQEFERMCAPLLERVKGPLEEALENAGLSVEDIQSVQCVGLTSQVPAIIKKLTDFFRRNPVHAEEKDGMVCFGCSKYSICYYMSRSMISNTIIDIFPFSIAMSWNTKEVTIEGDGQAVIFPKGCPTDDTIKKISFSAALTFSVGFKYSDIADLMIETRIGRFEIGPFQSTTGAKVHGEFIVLLDENGIFSVESASISEDGKWVKIQVSCLNESQEHGEESNEYEHVDNNLLKASEKPEETEHLIEEKERQKKLDGVLLPPINHLGFHLGTYESALAARFIKEAKFDSTTSLLSECCPDFPLQHPLSMKTLIGHKLSDLELHSPEYLVGTKLSDGHDGFLVLLGNTDGLPVTIPQLLSKALLRLLERYQAFHQIGGDEITYSCCIGIPIYFTHIQRSIVHDAARQAGFTSIALVHETSAAALHLSEEGLLYNYPYVVFVDMGVISMQVSVVKCQKGRGPQILSHAFDSALGGRAFDMVLLNHFVVEFMDEHGIDATNDSDLYWKLYSRCEKMKIELSTRINASFVIRVGDKKLIGFIKREEFERMCAPLLERVKGPLEEALDNAGLSVEDIQSVQCVGLTSQVPAIIKKLTDLFGREPIHAEGKDCMVSFGCSRKAYYMSQNMISNMIRDIFPFSIAMSWNMKEVTIEGDGQAVVFPKGCPTEDTIKKISFSAALTFSVGFKYSDIADPMIETRIGRFEIGPFQSKTGVKVHGEFIVLLDENGIFSVESASISEDGKWVKIQVSRLNESQILEDGKEVDLQVSRLDELQVRYFVICNLLIREREKRKQLEAEVEHLKIQLKETSNLLQMEKDNGTKLLTNVKIELEKQKKLTEFSYSELKEATNGFHDDNMIGKGGYGSVYKGVIHCTTVAIKVLDEESYEGEKEFDQEVETLRKVRHPNLVTLIGACREKWALVYEFLPKGNLEECLRNDESRRSLCWRKRIRIASNICSALVFLHHTKPHAIVHGDLKPANIFLDSTYTCKLGDFGTCRPLKLITDTTTPYHKTKEPRGTICYFDPEYLETCKLTSHTDVFGYGVVLLQLVTGKEARAIRALVGDAIESGKLNEVVDASANWPLDVAEKMARLGLSCIEWKKKDRPDLAEDVWIEIESMEQVASRS